MPCNEWLLTILNLVTSGAEVATSFRTVGGAKNFTKLQVEDAGEAPGGK